MDGRNLEHRRADYHGTVGFVLARIKGEEGGVAMAIERLMVSLPQEIVEAIRTASPDTDRFVLDAVERELGRRRQVDALRRAAGLWSDYADIPETPEGIVAYVRQLRQTAERPLP
jgi:hypothetical protein